MSHPSSTILANWNGQQMPLEDVRVSVLDRAFMFGDAVYEVIRIYGGRLWNFDEHIGRLAASLAELKIDFDVKPIRAQLERLIQVQAIEEGLAYLQVTRGAAARHHYYPLITTPNCLLYVEHFDDPYAEARQTGAKAITFTDIRWGRNDIKVTSLVANCMAANQARQAGCIEALLLRDGFVTEGSHTSVFAVRSGKVIVSPSSKAVLPGITKKQVIELCQGANIGMQEGKLKASELSDIEELFITATPEEIIAIVEVDGVKIGNGHPGPVTTRLQAIFRHAVNSWLDHNKSGA